MDSALADKYGPIVRQLLAKARTSHGAGYRAVYDASDDSSPTTHHCYRHYSLSKRAVVHHHVYGYLAAGEVH